MEDVRPLYKDLEFRVTVGRVCRHLNLYFDKKERSLITKKVRKLYFELTGLTPEYIKSENNPHFQYWVYPVEFIPVMINIINQHIPPE